MIFIIPTSLLSVFLDSARCNVIFCWCPVCIPMRSFGRSIYLPSPVATLASAIACENQCVLKQGDCKNAFCQPHLPLDEQVVIVAPPAGCPISKPGTLWHLNKTVYGLRRSPHHWYDKFRATLLTMGFTHEPTHARLTTACQTTDWSITCYYSVTVPLPYAVPFQLFRLLLASLKLESPICCCW